MEELVYPSFLPKRKVNGQQTSYFEAPEFAERYPHLYAFLAFKVGSDTPFRFPGSITLFVGDSGPSLVFSDKSTTMALFWEVSLLEPLWEQLEAALAAGVDHWRPSKGKR